MVVLDLAADQHVAPLLEPIDELHQADLRGIAQPAEHRLTPERAAQSDAVESAYELVVILVRLDAVRLPLSRRAVKALFTCSLMRVSRDAGIGPENILKVLGHANVVGTSRCPFEEGVRAMWRHVETRGESSSRTDQGSTVEFDPPVAIGHGEGPGAIATDLCINI